MHYYNKNIADFNNATRHLTRQERSIYSDLLELQYDLETPLPENLDWICRRILANSESERTDVERMLNEYFDSVEQGWSNSRAEREIAHYQSKIESASKAGKASAQARQRNKKPNKSNKLEQTLNGRSTDVQQTSNQLITNNQEPITNKTTKDLSKSDAFDRESAFAEFWKAYPRSEGKKLAQNKFNQVCKDPVTFAEVMLGLREQVPKIRDVKFFPHATTWLNGERWKDEPPESGVNSVVDKFVKMEARHG